MSPALESLRRAVAYGLENGKRNVVADLAPLAELMATHDALLAACERLETAADVFTADQTGAADPRCGIGQPITVAEANELNAAVVAARDAIARATT